MGQNGEFNDNTCVEYKVGVEAHLSLPLFISLDLLRWNRQLKTIKVFNFAFDFLKTTIA